MPASDVPGYVLGYRFNAASYSNGSFAEQSAYGGSLETLTGTPIFETVDTHEGLLLDNTWHGRFWHPNAWQGTVVIVCRMERLLSGTHRRQAILFSRDGQSGNQGKLQLELNGGNRRIQFVSNGGDRAGPVSLADGMIGAAALCQDQIRRTPYSTLDGLAVNDHGADSGTINGLANAMGSNSNGAILGALQGNSGNTSVETSARLHVFELHFFEANPIIDAASEMQAFLAELAADYA